MSLSTYLTKHHKTKRKFKTEKDRKTYITRELKLAVQKDPRTGNYAVPVPMKTLMLTGHRLSAIRSKEEQFEDKASSKEAFSKAAEGVAVKGNTKDSRIRTLSRVYCFWFTLILPTCGQSVFFNVSHTPGT